MNQQWKGNIRHSRISRIVWKYFENVYATKLKLLEKKIRFLNSCHLSWLNQADLDYLNRSITMEDIQKSSYTKTNRTQNKTPSPDRFTREFFQTFTKHLHSILFNLFQEIEEPYTPSFYEGNITVILKADRKSYR